MEQAGYKERPIKSAHLTPRTLEVIRWLSLGKSSDDIGEILSISKHTVQSYIRIAKDNMGAANSVSLVAMCIREGRIQ